MSVEELLNEPGASRERCGAFGEVEQRWGRDPVLGRQLQDLTQRLHLSQLLRPQRDLEQQGHPRARLENERLMAMAFDQRLVPHDAAVGRKRVRHRCLDFRVAHRE